MKLLRYLSCVMAVGLATMAWSQPPGKTPKVDIFSAPNAGANPWQGTYALGITSTGAVGGYYIDANDVNHGFIRSLDGTLTVVDVAAAGTGSGEGTQILAMNSLGAATGAYFANGTRYAFMRDPLGNLTLFDIPGALGSEGQNINNAGTSAGSYLDGSGVFKGFLRTQSGELVTYDIPGSCAWCFNVQNVPWNSMNQPGAIVGTFWDGTGAHGWIRSQKGLTNEFNAPGTGRWGTFPYAINPQGAITGIVADANGMHGFLRDMDGNYTIFDAQGAAGGGGTGPEAINAAKIITGNYWDPTGNNHGFIRAADGTYTQFDLPGAGTADLQGTLPTGLNPQGWIAGTIVDDNFVSKSFVMIP